MDAPEDYARGEKFDSETHPIIQDIISVGGGNLMYDNEGNPIPKDIEHDNQAHDIIPVEDNDFINNEYDVMEAPIDVDLPVDTLVHEQVLPNIAPTIPEEERRVRSLELVEDTDDLGEERSEITGDDRDMRSVHNMSLHPRLPLPNAHRNTFEKGFHHLQKAELCNTFPNIDSEEDQSCMYRVVTGIITRESERLDIFVENNNKKVDQ